MSLFDPGPDNVDVYLVDDAVTSERMFRSQSRTAVRAGVNCWVKEQPIGRTGAYGSSMGFGREETRHLYQVLFGTNPHLTTAHVLAWTPADETTTLYLRVKGASRPQSPAMPFVAFCEAWESGELAS